MVVKRLVNGDVYSMIKKLRLEHNAKACFESGEIISSVIQNLVLIHLAI